MTPRQRDLACFLLTLLGTFSLWYFSRRLFHYEIPWGNGVTLYLAALFVIGLIGRLAFRATPKLIYGGVVAGGALGVLWPAFNVNQLCVPCQIVPILLFPMAAALGAWVASAMR